MPDHPVTGTQAAVTEKLERLIAEWRASSATLYVRDPHWTRGFRLVSMPGVRYTEPMHGFNFGLGLALDGSGEAKRRPAAREPEGPSRERLFADFKVRENVQASIRLVHPDSPPGAARMVLYVNFDTRREVDDDEMARLRQFLEAELAPLEEGLLREIESADASALSKSVRVLSPDKTIAIQDAAMFSAGPRGYLERILENTFDAFGLDKSTDRGAIYLHDPESQRLTLEACIGQGNPPRDLSVANGDGIASWVAYRRSGLLIEDVLESKYGAIYPAGGGARSMVAVPMILGEETAGVVVLEAANPRTFRPADVRPVWYTANRAAVAVRFYRQQSLNQDLMRLCIDASAPGASEKATLDRLASLARQHLSATDCDIWPLDRHSGHVVAGGASYQGDPREIRAEGWTRFILRCKTPVWIHDMNAQSDFKVLYGSDTGWTGKPPDGAGTPPDLNPAAIQRRMQCELGIPLISGGHALGVAWVRFRRRDRESPSSNMMTLARGFAAEAALVIEALQNRREAQPRLTVETQMRDRMRELWQLGDAASIEAVVKTRAAEATLGGDFYAGVKLNEGRIGILIGDGEGHAVKGSFNMLTLWSAFEASRFSISAAEVMERVARTARELGARGTALYGILTPFDGGLSLSATSAAHEPFLILRRGHSGIYRQIDLPEPGGVAHGGLLGRATQMTEDRFALAPGDVVIGYTDGISEPMPRFEIQATATAALEEDQPLEGIADRILAAAVHRQPSDRRDDATIVIFRVKEKSKK